MFEGISTALGSVLIIGTVGFSYQQYYKWITLRKIEKAFAVGYSAPEMAALNRHLTSDGEVEDENWIARDEQGTINSIIDGSDQGLYHLVVGEKGTGKTSMLLNAMRRIDGEGIALLEATGDVEIFRHRLGKALNYEFHEDYVGGLFSFKGPRDTTPLLDIERACASILEREKQWFLNQCWILGAEMDDNAEDHQDFSTAAMLLAKRLIEKEREQKLDPGSSTDPCGATAGDTLPAVPLHEARQIMTRPDFIQRHDHLNIFSIDSHCMVRADSAVMQNVFRVVCAQEGFEEHLQATLDRLDELESLGRTRELTLKELVGPGVQVRIEEGPAKGVLTIKAVPPPPPLL
jgi:hypothetical protein